MSQRYDWVDERRRHWREESPRPVTVEVSRQLVGWAVFFSIAVAAMAVNLGYQR